MPAARIDGSNISFAADDPLRPRNGLTIDVYIPKGVLTQPSWFTRNVVWFVGGNPGALLPVWAFAVMFGLWWWKGRDPDPGVSVAPMYEPPKGLTPAEAGTLLEDAIEARDITSTVIDLAVKGYIKIIEQNDKVLFITHQDYILRLMKPRPSGRTWRRTNSRCSTISSPGHDGFRAPVARWISKGEQLLEISAAKSGRIVKLAPRGLVEQFPDAHQPARKRPAPATRSAAQLDQVGLQAPAVDREQDGVHRDHRPRQPFAARRAGRGSLCVCAQTLSSSMRSRARLAPARTSSESSIS